MLYTCYPQFNAYISKLGGSLPFSSAASSSSSVISLHTLHTCYTHYTQFNAYSVYREAVCFSLQTQAPLVYCYTHVTHVTHSSMPTSVECVPQFHHMFLTIFSTILCKIIIHPPNKHHIQVSAGLSKYITVVTLHMNKWRHRRDCILSRFARYTAGCCPHKSAYLKEITHLYVKMKQVHNFSSELFYFMLIYKRNT